MKNTIAILCLLAFFANCNNKKEANKPVIKDTMAPVELKSSEKVLADAHYFWAADVGPGGLVMVKIRPAAADSLTAVNIIAMMNNQYPEIQLHLSKISNDTVFVNIPKSNYLTRQMGTTGSEAYLAEATYNLTEIKDINFVDYKFKEGDHAQPGTFSRTDFIRLK